jgi:hypothetical protein
VREQRYTSSPNGIVYEKIELPTLGVVAVIDDALLESLLEYSTSNPTGAYPNKMWKRRDVENYVEHPTRPDLLSIRVPRAASPETVGLVAEGVLWWLPA